MRVLFRSIVVLSAVAFAACSGGSTEQQLQKDDVVAEEMKSALVRLPSALVRDVGPAGVPTWIEGDLGQVHGDLVTGFGLARAPDAFDTSVGRIAPAFSVRAESLRVRSIHQDEQGHTHVRYQQFKQGLPVINGELAVHADASGRIYLANGFVRDGVDVSAEPNVAVEAASQRAVETTAGRVSATGGRLVYFLSPETGALSLAHEVTVEGTNPTGGELRDLAYVDAHSGALLARYPQVHSAINRAVYSANNGTSLPGTLRRSEGGAATGDAVVDDNYTHLGTTYSCYQTVFGRDSYNNAGAQLRSSVHYSTNYVNAYWNGSQMVYGDGDGVQSGPLGRDLDVTVHELTHAVTENESNLTYSNESGALNEAMSDIFAAGCESWTRSWAADADVWKIGEDIWTPGTAGDALRYMGNPTQDGSSKDYYPERYTGLSDNGGVHWNSGIANLAFKLLSTGGTHPRGKTSVNVTGIGVEKALRIFYKANTDIMTSSTNFQGARNATAQAATNLGYDAATVASVQAAWDAVAVPGGSGGGTTVTTLSNGQVVSGLSASTGTYKHYKITVPSGQSQLKVTTSGGTGDLDLYVKLGSQASTTSYNCRSEGSTAAETCTITNPAAGDWYIALYAYSSYSSVSLTASYSASSGGSVLQNGVGVSISGASGSVQDWTMSVPAGVSTLTFTIAGGTGDADLYVRYGAAPTSTTYNCRPYLSGNNETCTFSAPSSGTWYVQVRGYTSYSGVTLKGQY